MLKKFINIDKNSEIDAFDVIFQNRLIPFIVSVFISKNIFCDVEGTIFEPKDVNDFLKIWKSKEQFFTENEKLLFRLGFPTSEYWINEFSEAFLPSYIREKQKKFFQKFQLIQIFTQDGLVSQKS